MPQAQGSGANKSSVLLLKERWLQSHLGQLLFQLFNAAVQPLIFQPQHIKPVKKLSPLDLRPFKGAFESR